MLSSDMLLRLNQERMENRFVLVTPISLVEANRKILVILAVSRVGCFVACFLECTKHSKSPQHWKLN